MPSLWHVGTTQQNELLHPYGTEQSAPPADFFAFAPKSDVSLVALHEDTLLLAQIPVPQPQHFSFQRPSGELRHHCPSPLHVEGTSAALGLPWHAEGIGLLFRKLTFA